jgi:hypothetical protein
MAGMWVYLKAYRSALMWVESWVDLMAAVWVRKMVEH